MQSKPVINVKTYPRLRQKTMKLSDGRRNQPRAGSRAAAKSDLAILRIVRLTQLATKLNIEFLKTARIRQQLLPVQRERR